MKGLLIFWIAIIPTISQSQSVEQTLSIAEKMLLEGAYEEALSLYKRVDFFDKDNRFESQILEGLSYSYYLTDQFEMASRYFELSFKMSQNTDQYYLYFTALIKANQPLYAKRAAILLVDSTRDLKVSKQIMLGLSETLLGNAEKAIIHFSEVDHLLGQDKFQKSGIAKQIKKVDAKTRTKAIILSGIVPGMGQFYTGHYKEGFNSFLLIGVFTGVYLYTLSNVGLVDAIVSIFPWFHRYYVGGMETAAGLVDLYKVETYRMIYNQEVEMYASFLGK
jgi:tetratricopeptide (TPR) repeat protein